ncbi:DUF4159 domain-containing protein [Cognatishimia activa]|uniref:N-terminal double-transmembrane domain protein n=1 Tax=Cognatishimia activa TaxID=1715691 RepID=A0A0P1IM55_9RHOB|nr:DUF4159 domain-containing protein [Cognatishimia activa]CUI34870.1 hypothetical protein TA5113_00244 [Cognatishimia activa]CUK24698.1 hypothetical protein TA5114_00484 [Cognatishimia activa]
MFGLPLAFTTPWILVALIGLPVLWLLLRAVPPAPIRRRFPGVVLLLGLEDDESVMDRTPWWLLLLRMLLVACAIVAMAGPVLNPDTNESSNRPMLVLLDGSWASAPSWRQQSEAIVATLEEADRQGRDAAVLQIAAPNELEILPAAIWAKRFVDFAPKPWRPSEAQFVEAAGTLKDQSFDTLWVSDGLQTAGRDALLSTLRELGDVTVLQDPAAVIGLRNLELKDGELVLSAHASNAITRAPEVQLIGKDPTGVDRVLANGSLVFSGEQNAETAFALPAELRGRVSRVEISGIDSAGAVYLTDDSIRRREVALIEADSEQEGLELLSPSHFLKQALIENADLLEGALPDVLPANPNVIVLSDVAVLAPAEKTALLEWVETGGLLLRFAGPQMAASDLSRDVEDPLMPVRLRAGGRAVGGAMSWGEPKAIAPFHEDSPFAGLVVPEDLRVTAQVVAQPDPNLAERVLAELSDGTPLVTRKIVEQGQVVLFHVTANAEWSDVPLSGLFVQMLDRLAVLSASGSNEAAAMEGTVWQPIQVLSGQGRLLDGQNLSGVDGEALLNADTGLNLQPGLYRSGKSSFARNVLRPDDVLERVRWPDWVRVTGFEKPAAFDLKWLLLVAAMALLAVDTLASLVMSGRLRGTSIAAIATFFLWIPEPSQAQSLTPSETTDEIALAYVLTGDTAVDDLSYSGLYGLSNVLFQRTSVEPVNPIGVDLEADELAFFPLLYWPISTVQSLPSAKAIEKVNDYLRSGGMILFDTRDADVARLGSSSPEGRRLQQIAGALTVPALEPIPADHVLTRTFYLLQDFPGRYASRDVWVEAAPPDAEQVEGMPFRNLNDGVTPVVIGGNDWASAWATDRFGVPLYQVGRGSTGERQRELAYRFGVNLVMHVLTGNYKSDQVHVPALLDRLGQ